ncbi:MAG: hypothetical protein ABIP03_15690 [Aquihabitans sp.]
MYLFTRSTRIAPGHTRAAMTWATEITERATESTDLHMSLHAQVFSPETGTVTWSTFVDDLNQLEAAEDKLMVDDQFQSLVDRGVEYTPHGVQDGLLQLVHGEPDTSRTIDYVVVNRSVCAPGAMAKGLELGVAIAQKATELSGHTTMFGMDTTGAFGGVGWMTGYANLADLQAAEAKVFSDADFIALVDDGAVDVYTDDITANTQRIYRRLI